MYCAQRTYLNKISIYDIYNVYNVYHVHEDHKKYQNNIKISGLYPQPFNASSGASPWAELLVLDPTREGTAKQPWFCGVDGLGDIAQAKVHMC